MNKVQKISKLLGTATLIVALSMLDISLKPKSAIQNDTGFTWSIDGLSFGNKAIAAGTDIMTGGDGNLPHHLRFMYFLINGAPNGYPDGMSGPDGGFLGMIRQITGPDALGGGLNSAGYSSCTSVPDTGNASMTDTDGTYKMYFETPTKTIPTGYTGAGDKFEKRVVVQHDGTTFFNIEFNCTSTVGWIRMKMGDQGVGTGTQREIEVYYDTQDSASAMLELYMTYEPGTTDGNEYFIAKFQTLTASTYKFWIVRSQNKTGEIMGFRAAVYGNSGTKNANAFFLYENGTLTDTTTSHSDNNNIGSGGDVQCIDYSTATSPVEGTGCGDLSLDSTAGNPINDGTAGISISWVADTTNGLKNVMTSIAEPTNP